ncbi:MAG: BrnT family toxin [Burkholderiales bacterium]
MAVESDPKKNATNLSKHGLSLSDGDGVLNDPLAVLLEDTSSRGGRRWVTIGMNLFGQLCVVIHTQRLDSIRIISVRKATTKERRDYEKGI